MKKNEVFIFTAPNKIDITAVCLANMGCVGNMTQYLCYAQNKLFTINEFYSKWTEETGEICEDTQLCYGEVVVDYCILPEYNVILTEFQNKHNININH